jgi:flavin reductase (DIM6/NTAB) family NADH-FMN oxidoreductase RutF
MILPVPQTEVEPGARAVALTPDFDARHFRQALGQFATGVTIITTRNAQGEPVGFTANSFNSVSLEPPLVLWSQAARSGTFAVFRENSHYVINVLASDQIELSRRFGSSAAALAQDRFALAEWQDSERGVPVLLGCCAWFECFNRSRYEEGDHIIFVGEVERCGFSVREPLIFQGGGYHMTQPHPHHPNSTT